MKTLLFIVAVTLLLGVATSADSPPAQYIDQGACPFECCAYRTWSTTVDTVAHVIPDKTAPVVGVLKAGSVVEAITGEVHARPVRFVVKRHHAGYAPGDVLWVYTYVGEGVFTVWHHGAVQRTALGFSPYGGSPGTRCEHGEQCWGALEKALTFSWWIKVRSPEGWEGWSDQPEHFGNKDACG